VPERRSTLGIVIEIDQNEPRAVSSGFVVSSKPIEQQALPLLRVNWSDGPTSKPYEAAENSLVNKTFDSARQEYFPGFRQVSVREQSKLIGAARSRPG
jgi:hypothetical protein